MAFPASGGKCLFSFARKTRMAMPKYLNLIGILTILAALSYCSGPAEDRQAGEADAPEQLSEETRQKYLKQGKTIASATFAALSGNLQAALQRGGVEEAAPYCQTVAMPLVDSLSEVYDARIRRTSLKVRNPQDEPTAEERRILEAYHRQAEAGKALKPQIHRMENGEIGFFAPIHVMSLCLKCHGKVGEDLSAKDYALIKELYPQDEAIGYAEGDLRGMWSIAFARQ